VRCATCDVRGSKPLGGLGIYASIASRSDDLRCQSHLKAESSSHDPTSIEEGTK
jgi:hypothetical protein